MPFPNEHACRLQQPKEGVDIRRVNETRKHDGKSYDVIYQRQDDGSMGDQAYRYPKEIWDVNAAKSHCSLHNGSFEAAKDTAIKFFKKDVEKQIVYGVIFEPDLVDLDDEYVEKDDIEDAAHDYMIKLRRRDGTRVKLSHTMSVDDKTDIVESYIAPADFECDGEVIKEGSWVIAMKIHDEELWKETQNKLTGYSAGGIAKIL